MTVAGWRGIVLGAALSALLVPGAQAAAVQIFDNQAAFNQQYTQTPNSRVAQARFRVSQTNFDQALYNGGSEGVGANYMSQNIGNAATLSGEEFGFSLEHRTGQGFIFTLTNPTFTGNPFNLAWGTFSPALSGVDQESQALNGVRPGAAFDALRIEARAGSANTALQFGDLAFSGAGLVSSGSFAGSTLTPATNGSGDLAGFWTQWVVGDSNLALFNWTLTGLIRSTTPSPIGDGETLRFRVEALDVAAVPLPAAGWLLLSGLAGVFALGREARRGSGSTAVLAS